MKKTRVISAIFLAVFLCLLVSASAVHAQGNEGVSYVGLWDSDYITVGPGEAFTVEVFFCYVAPTPPRLVETVIAFDYSPIGCLVEEIGQAEFLGGHDYLRTFTVGAPSEPGLYYLTYGESEGYTCEQAKNLWNLGIPLGTVEVKDDESEEVWKRLYVENTKLTSFWGGTKTYEIGIYQRGNDLQIRILTPLDYQLHSGSVSISVDESVDVRYDTGNISARFELTFPSFYEIEPIPEVPFARKESIFLLAGHVPGFSIVKSYFDYIKGVMDGKVDHYKAADPKDILMGRFTYDYFCGNSFTNERDVVTFPWSFFPHADAVRINCPQMSFPYTGTYDMVFRVDFSLGLYIVRHEIALPIDVIAKGKTIKEEW